MWNTWTALQFVLFFLPCSIPTLSKMKYKTEEIPVIAPGSYCSLLLAFLVLELAA